MQNDDEEDVAVEADITNKEFAKLLFVAFPLVYISAHLFKLFQIQYVYSGAFPDWLFQFIADSTYVGIVVLTSHKTLRKLLRSRR